MVELRKLHLDFIPLEIVILCLLTHRWYQVELACHWVRLLVPDRNKKVTNQHFCRKLTALNLSFSEREISIHHDFHGTPAWGSPVHGHTLVYYKRHGPYNLCKSQFTTPYWNYIYFITLRQLFVRHITYKHISTPDCCYWYLHMDISKQEQYKHL